MALGDMLHGRPGLPIYGANGTLLYWTETPDRPYEFELRLSWAGDDMLDTAVIWRNNQSDVMGPSYAASCSDGAGASAYRVGNGSRNSPVVYNVSFTSGIRFNGQTLRIGMRWYPDLDPAEERGVVTLTVSRDNRVLDSGRFYPAYGPPPAAYGDNGFDIAFWGPEGVTIIYH